MTRDAATRAREAVTRRVVLGVGTLVLLAGTVGSWAYFSEISGAVIAPGTLVVESSVKKVQHPSGGIVGELRVREGERVEAGQLLVRLDETITRAELSIASKMLDDLMARQARLEAESEGRTSILFPSELTTRSNNREIAHRIESETRAFEQGQTARDGQKAQLRERISQLKESIEGYDIRQNAKLKEVELIQQELTGSRDLWQKGLYPISKLTSLEREAARLEGERGQLLSAISEEKGKITETELQILQVDRDLRNDVSKDLRETEAKLGEFVERKIAAEDKLKRIEIRAPQSGRVHQLAVHTVGGVIAAGDPIMLIVPDGDALTIDAKISPVDIDQLQIGQPVLVRFSAFNRRTTPEIRGTIDRVSADIETEPHSGRTYYTARVRLADDELKRLSDLKLVPGMPVEAFVQTGDRKVFTYLVKPLADQMQRALREE